MPVLSLFPMLRMTANGSVISLLGGIFIVLAGARNDAPNSHNRSLITKGRILVQLTMWILLGTAKATALLAVLLSYYFHSIYGTPGRIRTCDLLLRRQPLYPSELQAHIDDNKHR